MTSPTDISGITPDPVAAGHGGVLDVAAAGGHATLAARVTLTPGEIEADTGLSRQTLRNWERQHGFPIALRDMAGQRRYATADLSRLKLVKVLMDRGHAPDRVVPMAAAELRQMVSDAATAAASKHLTDSAIADCAAGDAHRRLALLRRVGPAALRADLQHSLQAIGVARFVDEVAAPLTSAVGEAWVRGHLPVYEEHACTEVLQVLMRQAIAGLPAAQPDAQPRVLLSTLPGEPHALGLLMAEAMLTLHGCLCISLGVQTPAWDLAQAARVFHADIVALSFSGCLDPQLTVDGLAALRCRLPSQTELWAGGSAPVLYRRAIDGVWAAGGFTALPQRLAAWHARDARG